MSSEDQPLNRDQSLSSEDQLMSSEDQPLNKEEQSPSREDCFHLPGFLSLMYLIKPIIIFVIKF